MSDVVAMSPIETALIRGDLSRLTDKERLSYFYQICQSVGVNPLTRPFEYLTLKGKLVLYARKDATDQLRKIHGVSITKLEVAAVHGVYTVTAYAKDKNGKEDSEIGAVFIGDLKGDDLANAMMKASTKAKRRVTLSICGLGLLDESELETIPEVKAATQAPQRQIEAPQSKAMEVMSGEPLGEYVVGWGKEHHGKQLKTIKREVLGGYLQWMHEEMKAGKAYINVPAAKEFYEMGTAYLKEVGI